MSKTPEPRDGEPIRLVFTKTGEPRYRVRLDAGKHPQTGKRRQQWSTFDTLTEARAHIHDHEAARKRGVLVVRERMSVSQLLDDWMLGARHLKPSTRHGYEVHLKPLREQLGEVEVQRLTKADVDKFTAHMLTTGPQRQGACTFDGSPDSRDLRAGHGRRRAAGHGRAQRGAHGQEAEASSA